MPVSATLTTEFIGISAAAVQQALNDDPEWRRTARFWNTRIQFYTDEEQLFMRIQDGQVVSVRVGSDGYQASAIQIGGPTETWREMLAVVPRRLFQDFFPAMIHHGIVLGGDLVALYAYYGALSRILAVMRHEKARHSA